MRLPIGTTNVSPSGGNATLIARRGEPWRRLASGELSEREALSGLAAQAPVLPASASGIPDDRRFAEGEQILWLYRRQVETAVVIGDDANGLSVWIPSGSARLASRPVDSGHTRDVPLDRRFREPWVMAESPWRGPGIVRVAPIGRPWSVWFFRSEDGEPQGAYVNLEIPHRRFADADGVRGIATRDLVLDLWIAAGHPGTEDIWLKDADELDAAVEQGRFTEREADAVRALADIAGAEFSRSGAWPLDSGWELFAPEPAVDRPLVLPAGALVDAARLRSGRDSSDG